MEYRNQEGKLIYGSHSLLKLLDENPKKAYDYITDPKLIFKESRWSKIGLAVDCLLTEPEKWDDRFNVLEVYKPYGLMAKFIDALPPNLTPYSPIEEYEDSYKKSGYKMAIDKVIKNMWSNEGNVKYYQYLNSYNDKRVTLSMDEYEMVLRMKACITSSPFAVTYFNGSKDVVYQLKIQWKYLDMDFKAVLDGVIYDHYNKLALPFDLKTTSRYQPFPYTFVDSGYFRQAALYTMALRDYLDRTDMKEYEIRPFQFIVSHITGETTYPAQIWEVTDTDLKAGIEGGTFNGIYYKGAKELTEQLKWHIQSNYWDTDKESWENGGVKPLNLF